MEISMRAKAQRRPGEQGIRHDRLIYLEDKIRLGWT